MPKSSQDTIPERRTSGRYSYLPWVDLICAGVPCQDWSVAGQRKGLRGQRSSLVYQFARVLHELRPTWFLFENVPGLLSSNDGRDFAEVLRLFMVKCGYGIQWRVLDSQFFGVAQRRRRLFIVGRFGKPCPAEILFEPEGCSRNFAAGEEARPDLAVPLTSGTGVTGNSSGRHQEDDYNLAIAFTLPAVHRGVGNGHNTNYIAATLRESDGHHGRSSPPGDGCDNLVTEPIDGSWAKGGSGKSDYPVGIVVAPITASYGKQIDSSDTNGGPPNLIMSYKRRGGFGWSESEGISPTLESTGGRHQGGSEITPIVETAYCLREDPGGIGQGHNTTYAITENMRNRSQGPGNYITSLCGLGSGGPDDNDGQSNRIVECAPSNAHGMRSFAGLPKGLDSARYRALGNAVTVNVIRWIGRRIVRYGG